MRWRDIGQVLTPERVLTLIFLGAALFALVQLALSVGASISPVAGWAVLFIGAGLPAVGLVRRELEGLQDRREHRRAEARKEPPGRTDTLPPLPE